MNLKELNEKLTRILTEDEKEDKIKDHYAKLENDLKELKKEKETKNNLSNMEKHALEYLIKSTRKEISDMKKYYPEIFGVDTKQSAFKEAEKMLSSNIFIPERQKYFIKKSLKGKHFVDKINEITNIINNAPDLYATDGQKDKKPILHYFYGSYDAYAYELDKKTGEMFGHVSMGYGFELGYFSMDEINTVPQIELDLYFDGKLPSELR